MSTESSPSTPNGIPPLAISMATAAAAVGISAVAMRRLVKAGKLKHSRVGRRVLIRVDELDRFLRASEPPLVGDRR